MNTEEFMKVLIWKDEYDRLRSRPTKQNFDRYGTALDSLEAWFEYKKAEEERGDEA